MDSGLFLKNWLERNKVCQPKVDESALLADIMSQVQTLPPPQRIPQQAEISSSLFSELFASPWRRFALSFVAAAALALLFFDFQEPVTPLPTQSPQTPSVTIVVIPTPTSPTPTAEPKAPTITEQIQQDAMLLAALGELDLNVLPPSERILQQEIEQVDSYYLQTDDVAPENMTDEQLEAELGLIDSLEKNSQ